MLPSVDSPRILNGYFKFFSACALTHTSIEAALELAPLRGSDIAAVTVRTTANNLKVATSPGQRALSRRFSIPFAVATALTRASADATDFDAPDPSALELAQRVTVEEKPEFTKMWPSAAPAEVLVTLINGTTIRGYSDNARGTAARPVGGEELRDKSAALLGDSGAVWDSLTNAADSSPVAEVMSAAVSLGRHLA
ncbi:hypothetical protein ACHMXB_21830 (plasmid) [Arthrobacter sp. UC242_113]|uniref:hypothetical protein n=1 Tax=Arthrobacter sp. UC242_113 TaxID=3374550 RepID=UPI00375833F5